MLKTNQFSSNSAVISGFLPEVHSYGFNGKELDSEGMGGGSSTYDYGFRIYNPAIGRFFRLDPLLFSATAISGYSYAGNGPIVFIDYNGLIKIVSTISTSKSDLYPHAALAIQRFTNIVNNLGYLLDVSRTFEVLEGGTVTQTVLEYLQKNTGLSNAEIQKQLLTPDATLVINIVDEVNFGFGAFCTDPNTITVDIDALQYLGLNDLDDNELADLAFMWALTVLHEFNHAGDKQTNDGVSTGGQDGLEQPAGKQDFSQAPNYEKKPPKINRHRGTDMEVAFFGESNTVTAVDMPIGSTGNVIKAGSASDMKIQRETSKLSRKEILKESRVKQNSSEKRIARIKI